MMNPLNRKAGDGPSPLRKAEVLRERARILAVEPVAPTAPGDNIEIVEFLLATERYAVESARIREVYPLRECTPLPCTPPFVRGMINVRGQIIVVMDVRCFFELAFNGLTSLSKVLIIEANANPFGILADAVLGVRSIPLARIQAALPTLTGTRAAYLRGITEDRTIILDPDKILSDPRVRVHEEVNP